MRLLPIFLIALVTLLSGCATGEYAQYTKAQEAIAVAKGNADAARYRAMADIAASGDSSAKVAAVMAMALGQSSNQVQAMAAPAPNAALQWASILIPSLTQIYGIRANADVAIRSSDNATATSIATTSGFVSIAGQIQAPGTSYVYGANSGSNSGNSGRIAGSTLSDATYTPIVVTQPSPLIVNQPSPLIVNQPQPIVVQPSYAP